MIMAPQSSLTPRVGTTLRGRDDLMGENTLRLVSNSESQTEAFGREMGASLRIGDAVLLYGEMGAGKTCMARGDRDWCRVGGFGSESDVHHCGRVSGAGESFSLRSVSDYRSA